MYISVENELNFLTKGNKEIFNMSFLTVIIKFSLKRSFFLMKNNFLTKYNSLNWSEEKDYYNCSFLNLKINFIALYVR